MPPSPCTVFLHSGLPVWPCVSSGHTSAGPACPVQASHTELGFSGLVMVSHTLAHTPHPAGPEADPLEADLALDEDAHPPTHSLLATLCSPTCPVCPLADLHWPGVRSAGLVRLDRFPCPEKRCLSPWSWGLCRISRALPVHRYNQAPFHLLGLRPLG